MELFLFRINTNITWQRCLRLHLTSEWEWYKNDVPLALLPLVSPSECLDLWERSGDLLQAKVSTEYWEGWKRHSALLCCHSQSHEPSPGSPYISRCCQGWHWTQHRWSQSAASSLAFLSEMMTPCFWWWRTSAQHVLVLQAAQVMSLPQGRAQPPPCSSALGQPAAASCQPLPPPSRFQSWRGFPELKYLAYK